MILTADDKRKQDQFCEMVIREYNELAGVRGNWDSHWQEIAERLWPMHARLFQARGWYQSEGEKRNEQIFDSTPVVALQRFGAILDSMMTPQNSVWHKLRPDQEELLLDYDTKLWFDLVNKLLFKHRYAPTANFAGQNQVNYKSIGAYGNSCMFVDALQGQRDVGIRYKSCHMSSVYFRENHQGIVDSVYRFFQMTARQALQVWPESTPERIRSVADSRPDQQFAFIHCVKGRQDYDPRRKDSKGLPFASYYVSYDGGHALLDEGGYRTFPYAIGRYEQAPNEVYGRSPAMDVLPAVKTLNEEKKTVLKTGHRTADPVLLGPDDGVMDGFSLRPGAYNPGGVTADGRPLVHTLPVGRLDIGKELMDDERAVINDAFLVSLFQILTESPQMTATEVMERTREKGILMAPTLGRQQSEYLGPMIERELDILISLKVIPPMPPALMEAGAEYAIRYDSPLARAARAEEATGLMRTVETAINIASNAQNPAVLDHFNWDVIMPELADIQGVPAKWMNSLDAIQQIRQGRQEQMEQQTAMQAAPGAAAMISASAKKQKADSDTGAAQAAAG